MRILIQRVSSASVTTDSGICASIGAGLLLLVGAEANDDQEDIDWLVQKIIKLRIFADDNGVMNRSLLDVDGQILAVSQFTLFASTRKGNRPSWNRAAPGEISRPLFHRFVDGISAAIQKNVPTGVFGADMQVALVNDGPVTLWLDSQAPE